MFKRGYNSDIIYFEDVVGLPYSAITAFMTNERLLVGDWAKGPAGGFGSNETDWTVPSDRMNLKTGQVTESWDIDLGPELSSVTWHIRKGMHWALNPNSEASRLVNGRELTAEDVLFSLNQVATDKRAYIYRTLPELRAAKITQPDQWSVKIEIKTDTFYTALTRFGDYVEIVPPEVVKKYGTMTDWRNSVGTGPFMLTDFVSGGSATLDRNPNYWMKDPIGPGKGNQLPYLDSVKILIIKDLSTLYAALRTAKI
ncbi:MAG: hypothetical protein HYX81_00290, partial [Chloroflexi bacterium]|nr:hypothetical protein [Chloroflexota bacterium]